MLTSVRRTFQKENLITIIHGQSSGQRMTAGPISGNEQKLIATVLPILGFQWSHWLGPCHKHSFTHRLHTFSSTLLMQSEARFTILVWTCRYFVSMNHNSNANHVLLKICISVFSLVEEFTPPRMTLTAQMSGHCSNFSRPPKHLQTPEG